MNNIVLIGYMGSGKSSLGIKLSHVFSCEFVDTDSYIENMEAMTISEIFRTKGEPYFRECETRCLYELLKKEQPMVIATGGGLPLKPENQRLLHQLGKVVFLKASCETTYERVKSDTKRPLLAGDRAHLKEKINHMLKERMPIYQSTADMTLNTDDKTFYSLIEEMKLMM